VKKINTMKTFRVAVDIPTGIDSDTGIVLGDAVKADLTITFHKTKLGLVKAKKYTGELVVKDIGLPHEFERFAGPGDVSLTVKPRPSEAHKGDFGRLLIIGGSDVFSGAPALVALAALRAGVDLAYVAAPEKTAYTIASMSPNLIAIKLEGEHLNPNDTEAIKPILEASTAVVIGPGLGLHKETEETVNKIIAQTEATRIPILLDADGLKAFAEFKRKIETPLVLTPHAGEYKILTGNTPSANLKERAEEVRKTALKLGAIILFKGNVDIISDGKRTKLNFTGNPGMTVGGTGDVLSGIVGAFLAQKVDPFEAAVAGAFINGAAGDFVKSEKGYHMVSTDILDWIPTVIDNPMSHLKVRKSVSERN
jgi:NAD(P)H-hydrate epimerase